MVLEIKIWTCTRKHVNKGEIPLGGPRTSSERVLGRRGEKRYGGSGCTVLEDFGHVDANKVG